MFLNDASRHQTAQSLRRLDHVVDKWRHWTLNTKNLFLFVSLLVLSACGRGGSDTTPPPIVPVENLAPVVNAGLDATIRLPVDNVALDATVTDDDQPAGATVSTVWSVQSGPAGASFSDVNAVDATVTFTSEGTYILELTADDTDLQSSDTVTVIVEAAPIVPVENLAPVVNAGLDATIRLPVDNVALDATVTDDDQPAGATVSTVWSVQSGPAGVSFSDVNAVDTTVTFTIEGTYILELTADDTDLQSSDTVTVIVEAAPALVSVAVTPADVLLLTGGTQTFSATGMDQYGDAIAVNFTWTASGGSIDQAGNYVAGGAIGAFTVTATAGAVSATANVTIEDANVSSSAYWKLDEGVGTTAADFVGDSDGTVVGATWAAGVNGSSLDFDPVDNAYVGIDTNTPALDITGTAISLEAWIYPRNGDVTQRVISKRTDAPGDEVYAMIIDDYRLVFKLDGVDMISSHIIRLNDWVHVVMVYDGADKRIYVNGVLDLAAPQLKTDAIDSSLRPVQLGRIEDDTGFFDGQMDEVQVYDRALSAAEVAAQYALIAVVPPAAPGISTGDISVEAGIAVTVNGGKGVMFAEVDNDSLPDFYLTNGIDFTGPRDDLYFNNLTGVTFAVDAAAGIADTDGGSHGAVWADLDNDGDFDLFNGSTWIDSPNSLGNPVNDNVYENTGFATGVFTDVSSPDILSTAIETRGVTAFDMDGDGDLDLFGVSSGRTLGVTEAFRNDGNFVFTTYAGGDLSTTPATQGVTDTDYDNDGDIDILAANRIGDIVILRNGDTGGVLSTGVFTQIDPSTVGITMFADRGDDGLTTADVDNDGDLDLLFVNGNGSSGYLYLWDNVLKRYDFKQQFSDVEGYMGGFADLDNDGWQDLVFAGDERIFMNTGDVVGTLFVSGQSVPVSGIADPRAIAFADIEGDGDLDFAIAAKNSRAWLISNDTDVDAGNWLSVKLVSPSGQAGAFGAKVTVRQLAANGGALIGMREAKGNHGYLAQDNPVLHIGLGSETAVDVTVDFVDTDCDGQVTEVLNQTANQTIVITGVCP